MEAPIPIRRAKSLEQSADELEAMLSSMAKGLVDAPNEIVINRAVNTSGFVAFEVTCRERDAGTLLGKRGVHAEAMRTLLVSAAAARKIRVTVQFMSAQNESIGRR